MIEDFETANDQLIKIAAAIEELSTNNSDVTQKVNDIMPSARRSPRT
jgi:methyl-accepting chemotaxis protein